MRSAVASTTGADGSWPAVLVQNHALRRGKHDGGGWFVACCASAKSCAPPWQARRGRMERLRARARITWTNSVVGAWWQSLSDAPDSLHLWRPLGSATGTRIVQLILARALRLSPSHPPATEPRCIRQNLV